MIEGKSNTEANRHSAGYNGSRYIATTKLCKATAFEAWEDTV